MFCNKSHLLYNILSMKKIQVITLLPEIFTPVLNSSMLWKAQKESLVDFALLNLRDFGLGPRRQVDDTPYGGGDGMLLMVEPLSRAVRQAKLSDPTAQVVLTSPRGQGFDQPLAEKLAGDKRGLIIICGRYEGVDERIMSLVDQVISLGDFVLTGGEIPAMAIIDAVTRLIPGVLGGGQSAEIESFAHGTKVLEFPQYTRPEVFEGQRVPEVLLSGHHAKIAAWRQANSIDKTKQQGE